MAVRDVRRSRLMRWAVPAGVAAVIAVGIGWGSAAAGSSPALPPRSAAELLAGLAGGGEHPFSGTVAENADLGLPALPGGNRASLSLQSLVTGSHTARVWYASPRQVRVALLGSMAESDVIRNGRDLWVWSSQANTVQHTVVPANAEDAAPTMLLIDPLTAAKRALAAIDPTTVVTVDGTAEVAGRAAYEISVTPRSTDSLVAHVQLAVDAATSVPLRVRVIARGGTKPAFETAFTQVQFTAPDRAVFAFTPPPGSTVTQSAAPATDGRPAHATGPVTAAGGARVIGRGWTAVVEIPDATALLAPQSGRAAQGSASALVGTLMRATTPVLTASGIGRLLSTPLVSVLLLADGRVFVGAVTPALLEHVAATAAR